MHWLSKYLPICRNTYNTCITIKLDILRKSVLLTNECFHSPAWYLFKTRIVLYNKQKNSNYLTKKCWIIKFSPGIKKGVRPTYCTSKLSSLSSLISFCFETFHILRIPSPIIFRLVEAWLAIEVGHRKKASLRSLCQFSNSKHNSWSTDVLQSFYQILHKCCCAPLLILQQYRGWWIGGYSS